MDIGIIILAIVQGIAEFLPISSSAHLIIFREVFNIGTSITKEIALSFDLALHIGTLLALVVVLFKDFLSMVINFFKREDNILINVIIATIPAMVFGLLLDDFIDNLLRDNLIVISISLIVVGIILYLIDKNYEQDKDIKSMTKKDALIIGIGQVFALIPGASRSGSTITAGRFTKLKREEAAKFSFYLSVPVVLGASLLQLIKKDTISLIIANSNMFLLGTFVSFITGILVINGLLNYIKKNDYKVFMIYRVILGIIVLMSIFI